jgi:hypothetical protein
VVFTVSNTGVVTMGSSNPSGVELQTGGTDDLEYTIVIPNQTFGTADLTVEKTVVNGTTADTEGADRNQFSFTAKLYLPDGLTPWDYDDGGFTDGTASFSLGHDSTKLLTVPLNAIVKVTETANSKYTTTASMDVTTSGESTDSTCELNSLTSTVSIKDDTAVTLTYTNTRKTVTLTVRKTVVGNGGDFNFTVTVTDSNSNGTVLCKDWLLNNNGTASDPSDDLVTGNGTGGTLAGKASFTLSPAANSTVQIVLTIPYGASVEVTETAVPGYTTTIGDNKTQTYTKQAMTANTTVTFTNTFGTVAPTGYVSGNTGGYWWILGGGMVIILGSAIPVLVSRRKRDDRTD